MQFVFVATQANDDGKVVQADRVLVRSHCMKGKNKREDSRRSRREAKRKVTAAASTAESNSRNLPSNSHSSEWFLPVARGARTLFDWQENRKLFLRELMDEYGTNEIEKIEEEMRLSENREPRQVAAMLAKAQDTTQLIRSPNYPEPVLLGDSIKTIAQQELLHRYATFARIKNTTFPIERCINFDAYKYDHTPWLVTDDAFFHCALFTQAALEDFTTRTPISGIASYHLQRTLLLLNQRLTDTDAYLMESTIFIIMSLTFMSSLMGNEMAVATHLQGMSQILHLSGRRILDENPKLAFKIDNVDLRSALSSGTRPVFHLKPRLWEPFFKGAFPPSQNCLILENTRAIHDPSVIHAYNDLQYLVYLTNDGWRKKDWLPVPAYQKGLHHIQTRLLNMDWLEVDPASELLRLCMLAFLSMNFRINERNLPYPYLAAAIHRTLDRLAVQGPDSPFWKDLILWMLVVINMADVEVDEDWLREKWAMHVKDESPWPEVLERLQTVMWIPCLHDQIGRTAYTGLIFKTLSSRK